MVRGRGHVIRNRANELALCERSLRNGPCYRIKAVGCVSNGNRLRSVRRRTERRRTSKRVTVGQKDRKGERKRAQHEHALRSAWTAPRALARQALGG
jgi:hypothetical protein